MNPSWRRCGRTSILAAAICLAAGGDAQLAAQTPAAKAKAEAARQKAAGQPKPDAAAAQGQIEAGINELAHGKHDAAVTSLSKALSAGSLPSAQTARALYYRGVAYRRQAKPVQAITDLTNSLWIKSGLTEEQRSDALQQRSGAYREAGLPDQPAPPASAPSKSAGKARSSSTAFSSVAPPAAAGSSSSSGGGFFSSLFGGGGSSTSSTTSAAGNTPAPATTASIAPRPAATASSPQGDGQAQGPKPATRVVPLTPAANTMPTGFQDFPQPIREVEVSTQVRAPQPSAGTPGSSVAHPWDESTKVKQGPAASRHTKTASAAQVAAPSQAAATSAPKGRGTANSTAAAGGNVIVQVAAVRSAQEAQGLAAMLQSKYARELAGRAPVVDQTSAGNFGSFYRVQVGPFASARATDGLCAKLKADGLDCRVAGQ